MTLVEWIKGQPLVWDVTIVYLGQPTDIVLKKRGCGLVA
jgi:hypothetical protein